MAHFLSEVAMRLKFQVGEIVSFQIYGSDDNHSGKIVGIEFYEDGTPRYKIESEVLGAVHRDQDQLKSVCPVVNRKQEGLYV
jgi:hypothetical protein